MSKILAVNAGSSSLKFQLFEGDGEEVITSGVIERIGMEDAIFTIKYDGEKNKRILPIKDHSVAVNLLLESLIEFKIVKSINEISGVGHRVVHGGELFNSSIVVTNEVVENLKKINDLAPLHNPANIGGYEAFKEVLPGVGHVFVFDTAFHSTMEKEEFLYPLPYEYYEKYGVRRYGAHGTSHYYVSNEYITRNNLEKSKIITCHIGNGASITAIKDGKCIATSMGFTPLSGVMMGTRCGDVDPAIVTYIMEKKGLTAEEVLNEFNKKSGLLGVSELSNDSREIEDAVAAGNPKAILANDKYVNTMVERIGSYFVKLGGCDAIIFTAGVGENSATFREEVVAGIAEALNVKLDKEKNKTRGKYAVISTDDSSIEIVVIPTNEELVIARDTKRLLNL